MCELRVIDGNVFTSEAQTLVNTVNCVGVMGAGIALECRLRYPAMYERYVFLCRQDRLQIGTLWLYRGDDRWILNFPTKKHWRHPSREEYLHAGLRKFMATYRSKGIQSVAFPLLGAQHGGLDPARSQEIMESYLLKCTIPVEIYHYDPQAPDDLFEGVRSLLLHMTSNEIRERTGLSQSSIERVLDELEKGRVRQLGQLSSRQGIGTQTLEKLFAFARSARQAGGTTVQGKLEFDYQAVDMPALVHEPGSQSRYGEPRSAAEDEGSDILL